MAAASVPKSLNMTTPQAKRLVLVSCFGAGALAVVRSYAKGDSPSASIGLGSIVAAVLLTIVAEVRPKIAGGFALVILATAAFFVGGDAWEAIAKAIRNPAPPPSGLGAPEHQYDGGENPAAGPSSRYRQNEDSRPGQVPSDTPRGGSGGGGGGGGSW